MFHPGMMIPFWDNLMVYESPTRLDDLGVPPIFRTPPSCLDVFFKYMIVPSLRRHDMKDWNRRVKTILNFPKLDEDRSICGPKHP